MQSYGTLGFRGTNHIYYMYIIGKYLSEDNEVIYVDRKFRVNRELYNCYDKGDIVSNK